MPCTIQVCIHKVAATLCRRHRIQCPYKEFKVLWSAYQFDARTCCNRTGVLIHKPHRVLLPMGSICPVYIVPFQPFYRSNSIQLNSSFVTAHDMATLRFFYNLGHEYFQNLSTTYGLGPILSIIEQENPFFGAETDRYDGSGGVATDFQQMNIDNNKKMDTSNSTNSHNKVLGTASIHSAFQLWLMSPLFDAAKRQRKLPFVQWWPSQYNGSRKERCY